VVEETPAPIYAPPARNLRNFDVDSPIYKAPKVKKPSIVDKPLGIYETPKKNMDDFLKDLDYHTNKFVNEPFSSTSKKLIGDGHMSNAFASNSKKMIADGPLSNAFTSSSKKLIGDGHLSNDFASNFKKSIADGPLNNAFNLSSKKLIADEPSSNGGYFVEKAPAPVRAGAYDHLINDDRFIGKDKADVPQAHLHIQDKINANFNAYMATIGNL
jgi:hypothetical protein